jgi:radical SAM superfamily enzyme YgiQ (UPF0313 family)
MRLLLTHGYFIRDDPKEQQIWKPYPPLGLLYLSSHLKQKGYAVEVYDSTFGSRQELFDLIDSGPAGIIGVCGNLMTRSNCVAIAARAKAAGWRVILGGPEPANYPDEYLACGADVIVQGEGELVLEELLACDVNPSALPSVAGIIFRGPDGHLVRTGGARLIPDLDAQPWPDRDQVNMSLYLQTWREHHGHGSISLITARGCPYHCNWCSHSVYGKSHRRRSPHAAATEVEYLLDRYQPETLWIADDVFTIHHDWILQYAAELRARRIRIPFECITRADRINERIAATLAELGCTRVWIGSESGSQRILNAMERGVTVEQVCKAVTLCRQNGIQIGMFLMWGYEGEDLSDIEATIDHVKACRPDVFFTTVSYPIKGTPYFDKVADRVVNIRPWKDSTDREFKIVGRHSRGFYQHADELLRSEMAPDPEAHRTAAAREALRLSFDEVEV